MATSAERPNGRRRILLLALLPCCSSGFKFMQGDWKRNLMPKIGEAVKAREAKEKFGDKKLVVVTGASSSLGRKACRDRRGVPRGGGRTCRKWPPWAAEDGFFGDDNLGFTLE